jgi:hypothetical protein
VTTPQIYKGSIAFIVLQVIMVGMIIAFPHLVTGGIDEGVKVDADKALQEMVIPEKEALPAAPSLGEPASGPAGGASTPADEREDPMKALQDAVKRDVESGKKP